MAMLVDIVNPAVIRPLLWLVAHFPSPKLFWYRRMYIVLLSKYLTEISTHFSGRLPFYLVSAFEISQSKFAGFENFSTS